jgi:hypothetical protein
MRNTTTMNSLPTEILKKIIKSASEGEYISEIGKKYLLKEYVLVNRKWAIIANPLLWKEVNLYHKYNKREFFLSQDQNIHVESTSKNFIYINQSYGPSVSQKFLMHALT